MSRDHPYDRRPAAGMELANSLDVRSFVVALPPAPSSVSAATWSTLVVCCWLRALYVASLCPDATGLAMQHFDAIEAVN